MGLKTGKEKYKRKAKIMAERWEDAKSIMPDHYEDAMNELAKEAGKKKVKDDIIDAYKEGIAAIDAKDFEAAVKGKEDKWYDNYVAKMFE